MTTIVGPDAAHLLDVARSGLGTHEEPPGSNRTQFGVWYGLNGVPWCDIWVSFVADKAGLGGIIWRSAYVPSRLAKAHALGQTAADPQPGDLACFDWNRDGVPDHIGIVEQVNASSITTIEGNAQPGNQGDQGNGDGVYRRVRALSLVEAFIRPPYQEAAMPTAQEIVDALVADPRVSDLVGRTVWKWAFPAPTADNPKRTESAEDRLVWAARGSGLASSIDTILGALHTGAPVTLSPDSAAQLAAAVAAHLPPGPADPQVFAHAVLAELGRLLAGA